MDTVKKIVSLVPKGPSILYFIAKRRQMSNPKEILNIFSDLVQKYGKVSSFRSGLFERTYLIANAKISHKIFMTPKLFPKYPKLAPDVTKLQSLIGKGLLATHSDNEWYEYRKQMVGCFKPNIVVNKYSSIIIKNLYLLLNEFSTFENMCVVNFSEIGILFSGRIICELLSPHHNITGNELLEVKRILDKAILEFHSSSFKKNASIYKAAMLTIVERLFNSYCEHKEKSNDSLIARMSSSFPNAQNSEIERKALLERILNIIIAGYETTATTISWLFYLLAKNPLVTQKLYAQIINIDTNDPRSYELLNANVLLQNTINEAMRIYPALWFNIRYCAYDTVIHNVRFKKNSRIMLLPYLSNFDEETYNNPEMFNHERFNTKDNFSTFPFGHGPRLCVGKFLAEMEIKLIVARFVQEFTLEPLTHPNPVGGVLLHPDQDIKVKLTKRPTSANKVKI